MGHHRSAESYIYNVQVILCMYNVQCCVWIMYMLYGVRYMCTVRIYNIIHVSTSLANAFLWWSLTICKALLNSGLTDGSDRQPERRAGLKGCSGS